MPGGQRSSAETSRPAPLARISTISGLTSAELAIGDRLVAGEVVLEATAPRLPCNTLAKRMEDPGFVKSFRDAALPGVYCRVIAAGPLAVGTEVEHRPYGGERVSVVPMFRQWFERKTIGAAEVEKTLAAPLAARFRRDWEKLLASAART